MMYVMKNLQVTVTEDTWEILHARAKIKGLIFENYIQSVLELVAVKVKDEVLPAPVDESLKEEEIERISTYFDELEKPDVKPMLPDKPFATSIPSLGEEGDSSQIESDARKKLEETARKVREATTFVHPPKEEIRLMGYCLHGILLGSLCDICPEGVAKK